MKAIAKFLLAYKFSRLDVGVIIYAATMLQPDTLFSMDSFWFFVFTAASVVVTTVGNLLMEKNSK